MASRKNECPPQGTAAMEKEEAERELDANALLRLCNQHCGGVPATHGIKDRVPTVECTTTDFDDGSGEACTTDKGRCVSQQTHHFKCVD
ncbi:hypothetical protein F511_14233 [Dorcoceras hygrometricum]|uniref:Uncharacterized protein n=1 Tax=Dorcoceras hygrometricum TaxID=472368 RepID=A0A2Z7BVX9_9LAMI|nr:hypothetical protein F511_14233 [Dorcoceras hygrometricum]